MNPNYSGAAGAAKLPSGCCSILSDKFKSASGIEIETGQIGSFSGFTRPLNDLSHNVYTFKLDDIGDSFLQLNTAYFWIKCKIELADGNKIPSGKKWGINSAFGLSFFKSIQLLLNGFEISASSNSDLAYKNYFEGALSFESNNRNISLKSSIFEIDDANHEQDFDPFSPGNNAFLKRYNKVKNSNYFDFCVPVTCDFFRSDAHLTPMNKITLIATRQSEEFLINSTEKLDFKIKVDDVKLFYNRIRLAESLTSQIIGKPSKYISSQTQIKKFALPKSITKYNISLFSGILPKVIVIGQILTSACNGTYKKNPFHFQNFKLNSIGLIMNGRPHPSTPYKPEFDKDIFAREYNDMFLNSGG